MSQDEDELVERLAALEHRQWMQWAEHIAETEDLSDDRLARWEQYMVPYDELDEDTKEHDRKWARKIIDILESEGYRVD